MNWAFVRVSSKLLTSSTSSKLSTLKIFHKYSYCKHSQYFKEKIHNLHPTHHHLTRFSTDLNLNLPIVNKTIYQRQFFYNVILNWNDLPFNLRTMNDNIYFTRKLKIYLDVD